MSFDAETDVSTLGPYNFRKYATTNPQGDIPEPSPDAIGDYLTKIGVLFQENRDAITDWNAKLEAAGEDKDKRREIMDEFNVWQKKNASEMQAARREHLAELCQGSPSLDTLTELPGRVFDLFEDYIQGELSPKGSTSAMTS